MKKNFNKKLSLRKETISNLNDGEMKAVVGGDTLISCKTCNDYCISDPYLCPTADHSKCQPTCNSLCVSCHPTTCWD